MTSKTTIPPSALSEAIVAAIWQGGPALPQAIATERSALQSELDSLARQAVEIETARAHVKVRLQLLDDLAAGRTAAKAQAPAVSRTVIPAKAPKVQASASAAQPPKSSSSASPSTQMSPDQRHARKRLVMDAARRLARKQGGEFSVSDLINALDQEGIDLGVRESHRATAVANIVFHSGDADFHLARRGVFSYAGGDKPAKTTALNVGTRA
jgi:hypothetical protein